MRRGSVAWEYGVTNVQENHDGLQLNEAHPLPVYADGANLLDENKYSDDKQRDSVDVKEEPGPEVNT